jgi:drug/metabolite transporter (DMT)-like permease
VAHGSGDGMTVMPGREGAALALLSALLFGASVPFAKLLLGDVDPWLLAGLLYLGSGLGLLALRPILRRHAAAQDAPLSRRDLGWLGGAVLAGGIAGPVLLVLGLHGTPGSAASLLLTLEGVFTALLAWFVFRESFDWRIAAGMLAIAAGALVLGWQGELDLRELVGPVLIALACLAWAIDNNLTRKVSLGDPLRIAMLKGLVAGTVNTAIALALGATRPGATFVAAAGLVGLLGYGLSLVLFVLALRHVGAARTGAYFATAPFVGAALAVPLLGEAVTVQLLGAGALMGVGVWLHLTERHDHEHVHEPIAHAHRHTHDLHHHHAHGPGDPPGEPHTHWHVHAPLRHKHPHFPDAHHAHGH